MRLGLSDHENSVIVLKYSRLDEEHKKVIKGKTYFLYHKLLPIYANFDYLLEIKSLREEHVYTKIIKADYSVDHLWVSEDVPRLKDNYLIGEIKRYQLNKIRGMRKHETFDFCIEPPDSILQVCEAVDVLIWKPLLEEVYRLSKNKELKMLSTVLNCCNADVQLIISRLDELRSYYGFFPVMAETLIKQLIECKETNLDDLEIQDFRRCLRFLNYLNKDDERRLKRIKNKLLRLDKKTKGFATLSY